MDKTRDHGGNLGAAVARFGGDPADWLDLSTGINPLPYPVGQLPPKAWSRLPDKPAQQALLDVARRFWAVPNGAAILAAPGASALIAQIPRLRPPGTVHIAQRTYNEHQASFTAAGWTVADSGTSAQVVVHPNNPTGESWCVNDLRAELCIIDESFCDVAPDDSVVAHSAARGRLVLKSFGKFWGLAGLRLGFAIGDPALIARLSDMLGPWPVSGPALEIGRLALSDAEWAAHTRQRLARDAARLDNLMTDKGLSVLGGTTLFRLYRTTNAQEMQNRLGRAHIWSRIFPYDREWIRLGLPPSDGWDRIAAA